MQNLIVIYGCHGAGKTTLAKNIIQSDGEFQEYSNEIGKYTVSQNKKYVACGKYTIKCGGADSLKSTDDYFRMIDFLLENYPNSTVVIEGIFLSALFTKPLKQFLKYKYEKDVNITQVFLYTTVGTSFERVFGRNNREPKLKNIENKQKSVLRTFKKFSELGEFNNFVINTEGKTADEVYDDFRKQYKAW